MFGFLRGVFGGVQEPPSDLAARLATYVEALVALGGLQEQVDEYLADPQGFEVPEDARPESLAHIPLEAQMYLSCFAVQSFMESGSTDAKEAAAVMDYVFKAGGRCTEEQAQLIAALGMRLRGIFGKDPSEDEDWERELRAYAPIAAAAVVAAQGFMAREESESDKPTPDEIEHFLVAYIKEDERAAELQSLAEHLSDYAQRLTATAILAPNLGEALADPEGFNPEALAGKGHFDWTVEAQIFLMSLVLEVCFTRGFEEDKQVFSLVGWVLEEGLRHPEADVQGMTVTAAQLRHLVLKEDEAEAESEEVRRLIPFAAHGIEVGKAVAARIAAGETEIPDAELEDFAKRFGDQD